MMRFVALGFLGSLVAGGPLVRDRRNAPIQIGITGQSTQMTDPETGVDYDRMEIGKGQDVDVSFSLSQAPHCADDSSQATGHCTITLALTNTRPDQVTLSKCYVRWNKDNWQEERTVTISAVENFQDDGEKTIRIVTEPLDSPAEYYKTFDPPDIEVVTPRKPSGECSSTTDPNYRQFDGQNGVVNTAGTYNMWLARHRDWTVQTRVVNSADGFNCGVAIRDGCHRIVLDRCSGSFAMRKYFSPDVASQPRITREGSDTYIVTSRRSGARVRVQLNTRIIRGRGRSICGWSGCRVVYTYLRQDWMNVNMYAPGSDYGLEDTAGQSEFRTRGVCGSFDGNRANDGTVANFVNQFRISQSNSYFSQDVPANCESYTPPDFAAAECPIPPQRIMLPIISTVDVEDITDLIKRAQPGDNDDPRIRYNYTTMPKFDAAFAVPPQRSQEFTDKATIFCEAGLTTTSAYARCEALEIDTARFLQQCLNDVTWQADADAFDDVNPSGEVHNWMLESTLESMQQFCISTAITNPDQATMVCNRDLGICDTVTVDGLEKCVGDCTVKPLVDPLTEQLVDHCPRNCSGRNIFDIDGEKVTPGRCVLNAENKTRCFCNEHFQGEDCSIRTDDLPVAEKVFPHGCDTNSGEACPEDVAVEGENFYASETLGCKWFDTNSVETLGIATVISSTIIRCTLPAAVAQNDASNARIRVSITLDGAHWSEPLGFVYYDSTCWACHDDGSCDHVAGTCFIDGACYAGDATRVVPGESRQCQMCDPRAPNGNVQWTYQYADGACAVEIDATSWNGRNLRVPEDAIVGQPIDRSPADRFTILPHGDDVDITWTVTPEDYFEIGESRGCLATSEEECYAHLIPLKNLDHETRPVIPLEVVAHAGEHASAPLAVRVQVDNVDEVTKLTCTTTQVSVAENAVPGTPVPITCTYDDEDRDQRFGEVAMSLSGANAGNFALVRKTGNSYGLETAAELDYESSSGVAHVAVVASTQGGQPVRVGIDVTVVDVNEKPVKIELSVLTVQETAAVESVAAQILVSDPEVTDQHTITILDDSSQLFRVDGDMLVVNQPLNFESFSNAADRIHRIKLKACDGGGECLEQSVAITITDGNDKPSDIHLKDETTSADVVSLDESTPVGTTVGVLSADDEDELSAEHHTYILCNGPSGCSSGAQADAHFRILGGNRLVLKAPLDFEAPGGEQVTVTVQIVDEHPEGTVTSEAKVFNIQVNDSPDVPRDFRVVLDETSDQVVAETCSTAAYNAGLCSGGENFYLLTENPTAPAVVGHIEAIDQDDHDFTFTLPEGTGFSVGATACESEGTAPLTVKKCTAPLTVVDPSVVDFEGEGRESLELSTVGFLVTGTDAEDLEGSGIVRIPIKNVNEPPSGISYVRSNGEEGTATRIQVELGAASIASLVARDPDSDCPATVSDCDAHSSVETHTFVRVGPSDVELSPACAEALPDSARASGKQCTISFLSSVTPVLGAEYPVNIAVTDKDGLAFTENFVVVVVQAVLSVELVDSAGAPVSSVDEFGKLGADAFDVKLKITGWTRDDAPQVVLSGTSKLVLGKVTQSRRREVTEWTVDVEVPHPASIDHEESTTLSFTVGIPAVGYTKGFSLAVNDVEVEDRRVELCQTEGEEFVACQMCGETPETACTVTAVYAERELAPPQSFVDVSSDGSKTGATGVQIPGSVWVEATGSNGRITLTQSPQLNSRDAGEITNAQSASTRAFNFFFRVHVTCPAGSVPTPSGCGQLDAGGEIAENEASTEASAMDGGTIAGIVIAVLFICALLVSLFMWKRNEAYKEDHLFDDANARPALITGRANALYGWYQHNASKESAYAALSKAPAGDFIVRGPLRNAVPGTENPLYQIHVKTNQMVIKDELIDESAAGFALRGQPQAFGSLDRLVDHYGAPNTGAGFSLNVPGVDNPMYAAVQMMGASEDIYGNSNIKNTRIDDDADAPVLQAKRASVGSRSQYVSGI